MSNQFLDVIRRGQFVVLDTETTGLNRGEICAIAIVESDGRVLLDTLVKTQQPIPGDATRIHGITNADVADAPSWPTLTGFIQQTLTGRDVVVYNAVYDRKMMHQSAEAAALPKTEWKDIARWWCAMEEFAPIYGEWNDYHGNYRYQKLVTAARYYRVPVSDAHSALGDCLMTLAVVKAMAADAVTGQDGTDGVS